MTRTVQIAMAQVNPVMGDVQGNLARVKQAVLDSRGADILLTPELVVCGYPPEDLVQRPSFIDHVMRQVQDFAKSLSPDDPAVVLGTPWQDDSGLYNAAVVMDAGAIVGVSHKVHLPNYGVFDEKRLFQSGQLPDVLSVRGIRIGLPICEDIWEQDVCQHLAAQATDVLLVLNGSPYSDTKQDQRLFVARARVAETRIPLVYVNQIGGQDELVFDGASFALDSGGRGVVKFPDWLETVATVQVPLGQVPLKDTKADLSVDLVWSDDLEATYQAMVLGLRDYVNKNGFPGVVLGLSGGIDSGLSLVVAVDALGPERVRAVMMPSQYTSNESLEDARAGAEAVGVRLDTISIAPGVGAFADMLSSVFEGTAPDTTEENIQARLRGLILMSISNKFGHMVLTTGNKSEMSVGYATLYGDMCGGYSVLKDVYKMQVFALSKWRNSHVPTGALGPGGVVVPERVITKPPSAELRPDQQDSDSLPPYEDLDAILYALVEQERPVQDLIAQGFDEATVARIEHLLYVAEYKRRQAPPGVKITARNFGRDRRYPITNRFRDQRS